MNIDVCVRYTVCGSFPESERRLRRAWPHLIDRHIGAHTTPRRPAAFNKLHLHPSPHETHGRTLVCRWDFGHVLNPRASERCLDRARCLYMCVCVNDGRVGGVGWYVSGIDLCSFAADTRAWTLSGAVINSTVHHIKNVALGVQTNRKKEMHHTQRATKTWCTDCNEK